MAEGQVLHLQRCSSSKPRLEAEQYGKKWSKHGGETLTMAVDKINDFSPKRVFGTDRPGTAGELSVDANSLSAEVNKSTLVAQT
jgi:hypothetical protein